MQGKAGTLEQIILRLGRSLLSLRDTLDSSLFSKLGLSLPEPVLHDPALAATMAGITSKLTTLETEITALETAIANENVAGIVANSSALVNTVRAVINDFRQIGNNMVAASAGLSQPVRDQIQSFAAKLAYRLIEYSIVGIVAENAGGFAAILDIAGVIDKEPLTAVEQELSRISADNIVRRVYLERLSNLFNNPTQYLKDMFGWGLPAFDGNTLFKKLQSLLGSLGLQSDLYKVGTGPLTLEAYIFTVETDNSSSPPGIRVSMNVSGNKAISYSFPISDNWTTNFELQAGLNAGLSASCKPPASITLLPATGTATLALHAGVTGENASGNPLILFGETAGSRLQTKSIGASIGIDASIGTGGGSISPAFQFDIKEGKLIIDTSKGDGFIQKLLGDLKTEADFDFGGSWSIEKGMQFHGSSALELQLPAHIAIGPVSIEGLTVTVGFKDGKIPVSLGADIKASLGPLVAVVQNMGVTGTFSFPANADGNLGPVQLDIGFKPPNGVGLSLDTGIIKGGGFLYINTEKGEYVGALELDFVGIVSLKAIGIINTIMPDGSKGFSLLIIITAEFPPIQLGFGFTLNAVGGLLGLNRTVKIDVLREGIRTNAIKSILFPQDVIANINRIVSDLKQVFPPYPDHFVVGPMAELGWGTPSILTLEIGLLLEIPVPRIAILGVIKALLPSEDAPLLRIQVNFLGVIDFQNQYISFDASLYDSRLLLYTLSGDMAFRLSWGDHPMFILSVGGFHPAFHDAPPDLQNMTRLTISLLNGPNPRITVQSYFAVTSNTVQFGAKAELYAAAAGFNVYGFIGYDVLFQFDPFKFIADFAAGLALRRGTSVIMSISVNGELSGPHPFNAKGSASVDFFFFSVSVSFNETWGDSGGAEEPQKIDIIPLLTDAIKDDRNWKALMPDSNNLHVSLKKLDLPPDQIVIHPFGILSFSERIVPLDIAINRFGNKVPDGANLFTIKDADNSDTTQVLKEQFAPANFFDKSDNEKLSSPSFERMNSGFSITGSGKLNLPMGITRNVDYELAYLHKKQLRFIRTGIYKFAKKLFGAALKGSAVSQSKLSFTRNRVSANAPDKVVVLPGQYAVANISDMKLYSSASIAGSYLEAKQQHDALVAIHPELEGQLQVLSHYELNMN